MFQTESRSLVFQQSLASIQLLSFYQKSYYISTMYSLIYNIHFFWMLTMKKLSGPTKVFFPFSSKTFSLLQIESFIYELKSNLCKQFPTIFFYVQYPKQLIFRNQAYAQPQMEKCIKVPNHSFEQKCGEPLYYSSSRCLLSPILSRLAEDSQWGSFLKEHFCIYATSLIKIFQTIPTSQ